MEEERHCLANKQRYCLEKVSQDRFPSLKPHPSNLTPGGSRDLNSSDTSDRQTQQKHSSFTAIIMKPEALDAFTTQTMRPQALEAAAAADPVQQRQAMGGDSPDQQQVGTQASLHGDQALTHRSLRTKRTSQIPQPHPVRPSANEQKAPNPQPRSWTTSYKVSRPPSMEPSHGPRRRSIK
jgi:hypothetical protein